VALPRSDLAVVLHIVLRSMASGCPAFRRADTSRWAGFESGWAEAWGTQPVPPRRAALRGGALPAAATLDAPRLLQLWDARGPPGPAVRAAH